jgi:hypothetical protein
MSDPGARHHYVFDVYVTERLASRLSVMSLSGLQAEASSPTPQEVDVDGSPRPKVHCRAPTRTSKFEHPRISGIMHPSTRGPHMCRYA